MYQDKRPNFDLPCPTIAVTCQANQYVFQPEDNSQTQHCLPLSKCDYDQEYIKSLPSKDNFGRLTSDIDCEQISTCNPQQYYTRTVAVGSFEPGPTQQGYSNSEGSNIACTDFTPIPTGDTADKYVERPGSVGNKSVLGYNHVLKPFSPMPI